MRIRNLLKSTAVIAALTFACTLPARDIILKGGKLTTQNDYLVESFGDDMNFMFAYRFSDGNIHMGHSKGIHTVTEYGCNDISYDNGRTWKRHDGGCCGINSFEGLDGRKYQVGCWNLKAAKTHKMNLNVYNDETHKMELVKECTLELPYVCQCLSHRDIIRLRENGRLLATAYGTIEGEKKCHAFVYYSDDDGRTWTWLSKIATDDEAKTAEGPDEATIFQLKDGRVGCLFREEGMGYVKQCYSSDGGATWTTPEQITLFKGAASPNGRVLEDGTIVAVTGRPNLYLLIDFTGTGTAWQKYEVYHGSGSSYATVLETAPGEIMVIYDESNFAGWHSPTGFSRIHASTYKITRSDSDGAVVDPRDKDYDGALHFVDNKILQDERIVAPEGYKPADKHPECSNQYMVRQIPERPVPVLHLLSHGTGTDKDGNGDSKWPLMSLAAADISNVRELTIAMEFRLDEQSQPKPQLQFSGAVGSDDVNGFKGYLGYARFSLDKIELIGEGGKYVSMPYDIGTTKFHCFILKLNANDRTAKLYKEGDEEPLLTTTMPDCEGLGRISFGDGSGDIYGECDVSWFAWTCK